MVLELTCHLRAAGSGSHGPAFRMYGLSHGSAPGPDGLSLESDAFDVLTVSSVLSVPRVCLELSKNDSDDSDQTGSQPRSSVIVHRPSVRPFVRCSSESSCSSYLSSIVYRLSGTLRSLRSYAPTLPTAPGGLPTNRTPVCR